MIFEKASTRTRLSFEAGMHQLGGSAIYLNTRDSQLGRGEPVEDAGQVISRMSDLVMIRTFEQDIVERFAANSRVPVINGLTNEYHPCQILADIFTFIEHRGSIQGKTVAWVGDSNNMCNMDRRRQQYVPQLYGSGKTVRFRAAHRLPTGVRTCRRNARRRRLPGATGACACRSGSGCRSRGDRCFHLHGAGSGTTATHHGVYAGFRRLVRGRRDDAPRRLPMPSSCTACRPIAARKSVPN